MTPEAHLLIHNAEIVFSTLVMIYFIIFLLVNNWKSTVNVTLALTMVSVIVFIVSHMLGVSTPDPITSKHILMWNLSVIFISMFNFHSALAALKKDQQRRWVIILVYVIGILLTTFYLIFPDTFLLDSVPKMYFPNYYEPGNLHWVMRIIFSIIIPIYFIFELYSSYKKETNWIEKNRYIYFAFALILGYGIGSTPILLVYDIPIDPAYGLLFPVLFSIPFTYAVIKYELLDIRIIAKKAFTYGISIALVGGFISFLILADNYVKGIYPSYPFWATPLITAIIAVFVSIFSWNKMREGDLMKYEFITTVTHKFRTPLTYIKWATENLEKSPTVGEEEKSQLSYIRSANDKLVELTNILANVSDTENTSYNYNFKKNNTSVTSNEVIDTMKNELEAKKISVTRDIAPNITSSYDVNRIKFVMQVLLENAINYTPEGGNIIVSLNNTKDHVIYSVKDTGIGLEKDELSHLFSQFYRGHKARMADTEGLGIGLFVSKKIIERHRGKIWVDSAGHGRGSRFSFSIPI